MKKEEAEQWLTDTVSDMFMNLCYYDRKEDEEMSVEMLRTLMNNGIISKEFMVKVFTEQIETEYE